MFTLFDMTNVSIHVDAWSRFSLMLKSSLTILWPSLRLIQDSLPTLHIPFSFCPLARNICSVCCPSVICILTSNLSVSPFFNHYRFQFFLYLVFENILLQFLQTSSLVLSLCFLECITWSVAYIFCGGCDNGHNCPLVLSQYGICLSDFPLWPGKALALCLLPACFSWNSKLPWEQAWLVC